ncbi:uncharacterized protein LOC110157621 isoform X1 [Boleophthalmus pectinirostris]|uniref:uncharacterized protein LOC110157621 isoform X1 n=2 Tax=Boleophthalmus pectinirostris TaxID=150288 RepID=UPI00242B2E1A|nr:uncharacterized protein LOC110157621 isoform X1 [Boleophthalmus pectinirostris]
MISLHLFIRMLFRVFFLYILIGHLFEECAFLIECMPKECLKCPVTGETGLCAHCSTECVNASFDNCNLLRDFSVSINTTGSNVEEAERVSLTCVHDLPENLSVTYEWYKNDKSVEGHGKEYIIKKTFSQDVGQYRCVVYSPCGNYTSAPHDVTIHNESVIILVICGCAAVGLITIMGVCMKVKMHRDKVKNQQRTKERMQEMRRAQDLQNPAMPSNPRPT